MAITVGTGVTTKKVTVVGSTTQVKKVIVGTPVKRVTSGSFSVNNIEGIDTSGAIDGSILMYNSATSKWRVSNELQNHIINGGSY
jgi:hypothetical protein